MELTMIGSIQDRVERLHVSLRRNVEREFSKFVAVVERTKDAVLVTQDFSGGASNAELSEAIHALIHSIASFDDHLQEWGDANGVLRDSIHQFFADADDFCIVRDLWNNDKHGGYPPRNDGWSRKAPRLKDVRRVCELRTSESPNSGVTMTLGRNGQPQSFGDGVTEIVITGEVIDKLGNGQGDAHKIIDRALRVCQSALESLASTALSM